MRTILLLLAVFLSGCSYPNELRVTEYDGRAGIMPWSAAAEGAGCRIVSRGTIKARVEYKGDRCVVTLKK